MLKKSVKTYITLISTSISKLVLTHLKTPVRVAVLVLLGDMLLPVPRRCQNNAGAVGHDQTVHQEVPWHLPVC